MKRVTQDGNFIPVLGDIDRLRGLVARFLA
jgi:hypothetical protein